MITFSFCRQRSSFGVSYVHTKTNISFRQYHTKLALNELRSLMDDFAKSANIKDYRGWYKVTSEVLKKYGNGRGGINILNLVRNEFSGSISKLLQTIYPQYLVIYDENSFICTYTLGISPNLFTFRVDIGTAFQLSGVLWMISLNN